MNINSLEFQDDPQHILQGFLPILLMANVGDRLFQLLLRRPAGVGGQIQFLDDLRIRLAALDQPGDRALGRAQLVFDLVGVGQQQNLRQRRAAGALAFAAGHAPRPIKGIQEVRAKPLVRQVHGPRPGGDAAEVGLRSGRLVHRIEEHLGNQAPGVVPGEVLLIVLVGRRRLGRQLIDPAIQDGADHVLDVELVLDEVLGEGVQQLGVGRRVALALVVHFVDKCRGQRSGPTGD